MRIGIIGEWKEEGPSEETINATQQVEQSFNGADPMDYPMDVVVIEAFEREQSLKNGVETLVNNDSFVLNWDQVWVYGPDKDGPPIKDCDQTAYTIKVIEDYIRSNKPDILIIALEANREDIIPRIGHQHKMTPFMACIGMTIESDYKKITLIKPIYGGNITSEIKVSLPIIMDFRKSFKVNPIVNRGPKNTGVKSISLSFENSEAIIVDYYKDPIEEESMTDADLVVVCGYGVGSKENVMRIEAYAKSLGAVVAGTKKVIDYGWLPLHKLIGQTGSIIAPKVCLCIGASGATPFINGIIDSEKIIAINKDQDARIFKYADIGIVEDYTKVLKL